MTSTAAVSKPGGRRRRGSVKGFCFAGSFLQDRPSGRILNMGPSDSVFTISLPCPRQEDTCRLHILWACGIIKLQKPTNEHLVHAQRWAHRRGGNSPMGPFCLFPFLPILNYKIFSSTASPAGPFFLYRQKEGKERPRGFPPWHPPAVCSTAGPPSSGGLMVCARR